MPQSFGYVRVPSLAALYQEDVRLANVGSDYTRIGRPRRHHWSPEEKQILYILNQCYAEGSSDHWQVFLAYFAVNYQRSPKPRRSSWESMKSHNMNPTRYRVWWGISTTERLKAELEQQASAIGITLRLAVQNLVKASPKKPRGRRLSRSLSVTSNSSGAWDSDGSAAADDEVQQAHTAQTSFHSFQTPRRQQTQLAGGLPTPPSSQRGVGSGPRSAQQNRSIPSIAFRAFNSNSQGVNGIDGFVAGSFVGTEESTIPGPLNQATYLRDLQRHLARQESGTTPFISVCQNLLRVLHHAIRRSRDVVSGRSTDWKLAVIDLSKVESSVQPVWDLDAGEHSRKAFGEWVVYGSIPSHNVLSVLSMADLFSCMSRTREPFNLDIIKQAPRTGETRERMASRVSRRLTLTDGVGFGLVLARLGIPKRYVEDMCTTLLADWRYPEYPGNAWLSNMEFVRGLNDGYQHGHTDFAVIATDFEEERVVKFEECAAVKEEYRDNRASDPINNGQSPYFDAGASNRYSTMNFLG